MFLNLLPKKERQYFLNLARYAMGLNGECKSEELEIYHSFVHECDLHGYQAKTGNKPVAESIDALAAGEIGQRKAVMIELCGILLADSAICANERAFIDRLTEAFGLEAFEVRRIERWVAAMNDLVAEGYRMVEA
ncbi:hypothetical protein FCL40_12105 [Ferrimonas sediminicola]|uniref:Tellurite resistance protein TerB n=1 Tax=Ferrimonas sediminicola TaxID=2569538 RepID=A0A4U1BCM3_9GAMM|nr:TerB family tellurite resistance protein [Ferrimonas sediminicola]TKB48447.1 hypothetical protein FCL40_12105 [Ferrimonas sediminicola]